jgi:hypothetical protein
VAYTLEDQNRDAARPVRDYAAAFRASVHTTILLTAALRDALELLRDLRDYPLADLERRQEEIDMVITVVEQALRDG